MTVAGWLGRMWVSCFRGSSPPRRPAAAAPRPGWACRGDVGAHAQRAASDHAVDRRNDAGVGQVEFGAVDQRLRAQHAGLGRLVLRGQHVLLLARGSGGWLWCWPGAPGSCPGGCGPAHRPGRAGALLARLRWRWTSRSAKRRSAASACDRQRLADHRLMAFQRGVGVDEPGRATASVGAGRGQGGHVFVVVDAGQQPAGGDARLSSASTSWMKPDTGGATTVVGDDGGVVGGFGRRRPTRPSRCRQAGPAPASAARGR